MRNTYVINKYVRIEKNGLCFILFYLSFQFPNLTHIGLKVYIWSFRVG